MEKEKVKKTNEKEKRIIFHINEKFEGKCNFYELTSSILQNYDREINNKIETEKEIVD